MKRAILNEVLSRKPDKPLYHYTTQSGLLGIIGQKQIWATHTQFLNDRREFLHALDLVRQEIERMLDSSERENHRILEDMRDSLAGHGSINVCVCSFSEERDSLAQWRAYAGRSSGFAIGFPGDLLVATAQNQRWYLAPCIYDESQQRAVIRALVEEVFEENLATQDTRKSDEHRLAQGGSLCAYLNRYAPILKHRSFAEEREWRIISRPLFCQLPQFDFREGNSSLIPYFKLPLCDKDSTFRVHEIVVGPTPDEHRSIRSVRSFLVRNDLEETSVTSSEVPYRNW